MNSRSLLVLCALACAPGVEIRADPAVDAATSTGAAVVAEAAPLAPAQLDELLSPVALYPDPLIAIILPASTVPADIVLAARYLQGGGAADALETQPWDDSVKALARYPEVLKWMDENLAWTRQVGAAFSRQPADVLTCTQRLRAAARAAGNLKDSPEQKIIVERETIRIVPANPEIIYVPVYEPSWVYGYRSVNFYHPGPVIRFSSGYRTGYWLSYHCDWNRWNVVFISRPHRVIYWRDYPRWRCPGPAVAYSHQVWRPDPARTRASFRDSETIRRPASNITRQTAATPRPAMPAARPAAQAGAASISRPASSPTPPSGFGRVQPVQSTASAPDRGRIVQDDSRPRNRPPAPPLATRPVTIHATAPAAPSSLGAAAPSPRIQFPTTSGGSGGLSGPRPRPTAALVPSPASPPARENISTPAMTRRQSAPRASAAPVSAPPSGVIQTAPQSRIRNWNATASPSPMSPVASEAQASGSRRPRP